MNTYLIIYDQNIESDVLVNRIKSLGNTYVFFENHWFVKTNKTAKNIYEAIALNGYERKYILIVQIHNVQETGYWGMMNKALWEWLRNESV